VRIDVPTDVAEQAPSLLEEVGEFHATSMSGKYHEAFPVSGNNCTEQSMGTDAFIAEFDRLVARCVREADTGPQPVVREAFELLFGLLRHIDEGHDDVIFFADEGSSPRQPDDDHEVRTPRTRASARGAKTQPDRCVDTWLTLRHPSEGRIARKPA